MLTPVSFIVSETAFEILNGKSRSSWRYLVRKYIVPSDEIPNAILNTKMVDGLIGTPIYPITPAVTRSGKIFGIRDTRIIRPDLNIYAIKSEINRIASDKEMARFLTKYLVPFKKSNAFPVTYTLKRSAGNILMISSSIDFSISSISSVGTSLMKVVILAT